MFRKLKIHRDRRAPKSDELPSTPVYSKYFQLFYHFTLQVTSLAVLDNDLYIGTTWGCVIIAECMTLRPITIFRPYEEDVKAIIPLSKIRSSNDSYDKTPLLATVGRGYRSLLSRYADVPANVGHGLTSPVVGPSSSSSKQNMFVLLWKAQHWNTM